MKLNSTNQTNHSLANNGTNKNFNINVSTGNSPLGKQQQTSNNFQTVINSNGNSFNYNLTNNKLMNNNNNNLNSAQTNNGNIFIKTTSSNSNLNKEDEVDLLKDLLMKNLNAASNDPNFYGFCFKCNDKIIGAENGLKAMEQLFHIECFNCVTCGNILYSAYF